MQIHPRTSPQVRLLKHVTRTDTCWLWSGAANKYGYGRIGAGGKGGRLLFAHRVAWESVAGPIPDGLFVCHTCDNPSCVRNDDEGWYEVNGILHPRRGHLWLGTNADNMQDKHIKRRGRTGDHRGEKSHTAVLTEFDVREIRVRYAHGNISQRALARMYGVGQRTIGDILAGVTWRHVS